MNVALMALLMSFGTLRGRHVQRSGIIGLTGCSIWGLCSLGKARCGGQRRSFKWRAPRYGLTGVDYGGEITKRFECLRTENGKPSGFLFTSSSTRSRLRTPITVSTFNQAISAIVSMGGSPVKLSGTISSYSFRRWLPTWADLRKLPMEERQALGNWREAPSAATGRDAAAAAFSASMGLRYSGRKDDSAELVKLEQIFALRLAIAAFDSSAPVTWSSLRGALPDRALVEARVAKVWQESGELILTALGRALNAAPRRVQVVRTDPWWRTPSQTSCVCRLWVLRPGPDFARLPPPLPHLVPPRERHGEDPPPPASCSVSGPPLLRVKDCVFFFDWSPIIASRRKPIRALIILSS
ncbi:unnamed protein product [Prorocentrum cordatum]|uniref:Uncharacterized protein n=1 Tax=Prorocentrum cordatum TaxID=2364126 RepID=A0ABN9VWL2_9DINO|nr:unnamed protein product [Polarella glacialis]